MAKNSGITNAQNNVFDQTDNAVGGRTNGDVFSLGSALPVAFDPTTDDMWFGSGNPNTGWNLTDHANLETGLKVITRQGADYTPTGTGANGEQDYIVNAGLQIGNPLRAKWNFNYVINTAAGVAPGDTVDLASSPGLAAYDFKMQITQISPSFISHSAIFDLNPANHVWVDENDPSIGFGGDDFLSSNTASTLVQAHVAENSVNLAFLTEEFFGSLATSTAAGTQFDIKLTGFTAGTGNLQTFTHDHITLVGPTGLLGNLTAAQQIELIYVACFSRAADEGGSSFWGKQNVQAQHDGQSASTALTNIANSFTPQPETIALYPFLATPTSNLDTPTGQAGLVNFIDSLFDNLFGHAPDMAGRDYWAAQITSGAVGPGAAALAIANGASGTDATVVLNKIDVALDFTTRTAAAGLDETQTVPAAYFTATKTALNGVGGMSRDDASVTAAKGATTAYISSASAGHQVTATNAATSLTAALAAPAVDPGVITIDGSHQMIDPGPGSYTIQFLPNASDATLVLHAGGVDQVAGFDPVTDVLDLRSLLAAANINLHGDVASLGNYAEITDRGSDALLTFDPTGYGGGSTLAVLLGVGGTVTSLDSLVAQGAIRVA
jgi:hypothetical protein